MSAKRYEKIHEFASAADTLASSLSQIGMLNVISYRLKYEEIFYNRIEHLMNVDMKWWIAKSVKTRMDRDFRFKLTCEWDKEFAWKMWGWFVRGLEKGLIGDALFEFIDDSYWEEVLACEQ